MHLENPFLILINKIVNCKEYHSCSVYPIRSKDTEKDMTLEFFSIMAQLVLSEATEYWPGPKVLRLDARVKRNNVNLVRGIHILRG